MGAVIKHWVLTKLGLPLPEQIEPGDLRRGLSNGYLLAEILRKYSYISDDQLIALGRSFSEKTRLKNMRYVHRWMTGAGFDVNFAELLDIVEEKPGAVIKLLYRLYYLLEGSFLICKDVDETNETILNPPKSPKVEKLGNKKKPKSKAPNAQKNDQQFGTKLALAVKQMKKCMANQMCSKDQPLDPSDLPCETSQAPQVPPNPCPCPCTEGQKCKKNTRYCPDTQLYFTKLPCEQPVRVSPQQTSETNPNTTTAKKESKAQKKLAECPLYPIEKFPIRGDTAEATNLYFASQATLKANEEKRALLQMLYNVRIDRKVVCPEAICPEFKLKSIKEEKKLERLKAKVQAEFKLAKEMEEYDNLVRDPEYLSKIANRPPRTSNQQEPKPTPIQPNFRSVQLRMQRLKSTRKEEAENTLDRARLRKSICSRLIKEIPCRIYDDLMETALKKAMAICGREVELADFMVDSHGEKALFYNHMKFEENALQRVRCNEEDKLVLHKQREGELHRTVVHTSARHSRRITYEILLARQEAEALKNTRVVQDILDVTIDVVTKICQYRSATGSDPPKGLLQEWKASMFLGSSNQVGDNGAEVDMLDQLRLNDYLFHQGEWFITIQDKEAPGDSSILKIIVNHLLENLHPTPKVPKVKKAPIHASGIFALCGIEFNWKSTIVKQLLDAALPDYTFEVVDTAESIREALLLYTGSIEPQPSLVDLQEENQGDNNNVAKGNVESEGLLEKDGSLPVVVQFDEHNAAGGDPTLVGKSKSKKGEETPSEHSTKSKRRSKAVSVKGKASTVLKEKPLLKAAEAQAKKVKKSTFNKGRNSKVSSDAAQKGPSSREITPPTESLLADGKPPSDRPAEGTGSGVQVEDEDAVTIAGLVADTLTSTHPIQEETQDLESIIRSKFNNSDRTLDELQKLGKLALDQLLVGKQVDDDLTGRILAERLRHCSPDSVILILNYPNALCQALHFENSIKDITIDIPLCYHHVDSLIERYRQTWSEEAGDLLTLAMRHAAKGGGQSRSAFFSPAGNRKCDEKRKSIAFHSFLDGLIIADVNFNDKLARVLEDEGEHYEDEEESRKDSRGSDETDRHHEIEEIPDRAEVLLHTAFHHLKRFYLKENVAVVVPMNADEDEYYATMAYVVQKTLFKKKQFGEDAANGHATMDPEGINPLERPLPALPEDGEPLENLEYAESNATIKHSDGMLSAVSIQLTQINSTENPHPLLKGKTSKTKKPTIFEQKGKNSLLGEDEEEMVTLKGVVTSPRKVSKPKGVHKLSENLSEGEQAGLIGEDENEEGIKEEALGNGEEGPLDPEKDNQEVTNNGEGDKNAKAHHTKGDRYKAIISHIPIDSVKGLGDFWTNLEQTFTTDLKGILASIRQHHDMLAQFATDFRTQFRDLLERPDDRMALILEFQTEFNEILEDVREDVDVKTELHARVDELLERLEAISEEKYATSKDEIFKILGDGYLEGETVIMVNLFISLIQAETDRYCDTVQFINDFYKMSGLGMPDTVPWSELAAVDLLADIRLDKNVDLGEEYEGEGEDFGENGEEIVFGMGVNNSRLSFKLSEKGDSSAANVGGGILEVPKGENPAGTENRKTLEIILKPPKESHIPLLEQKSGLINPDRPHSGHTELLGEDLDAASLMLSLQSPVRSVCGTPSTARTWEFEVFNPDAYYDDDDINIDDSDYYEDEVTLEQISLSDDLDVDSWAEGNDLNATEDEYTTTTRSVSNERHVLKKEQDAAAGATDAESIIADEDEMGENDEEQTPHQQYHRQPPDDHVCSDESPPAPPASDSSSALNKLSPNASSSSIPESYFLNELCNESPPLSPVSSGASCISQNEDGRNYDEYDGKVVREGDEDLCSSSGESCSDDNEVNPQEQEKLVSISGPKNDNEEDEGATEEEEELRILVQLEEAEMKGVETSKSSVGGQGSKVGIGGEIENGQENGPGEVFIEGDGGSEYDDDAGDGDFGFLEPHWKFKPKRTFMDMILDSLDESWVQFDRIVETSGQNILKVEDFIMDSIGKGSPKEKKITPSEVLEKNLHSSSHIKKKNKKKSVMKIGLGSETVEKALSQVPSTPHIPIEIPLKSFEQNSKKHVKGSKRFADWEKAIQAETERVKYQVAVIQARAIKELKQLKDIIVQVVSDAKVDASNFYIDELQSAYMACEVFRFGIENETGVQAKIIIEKDKFAIEPDVWFQRPSPLPPVAVLQPETPEGSNESSREMTRGDEEVEIELGRGESSQKTGSIKSNSSQLMTSWSNKGLEPLQLSGRLSEEEDGQEEEDYEEELNI